MEPGRAAVGVSDHELVAALAPVVADLGCPVVIVTSRPVAPLTALLKEVAATGGPAPVIAVTLADVEGWLEKQTGPVAVVCYLMLWRAERVVSTLGRILSAAAPGSRLVFAEPTAGAGWWFRLQSFAKPMFRRRLGVSFHRDVPDLIRQSGWRLTTVNRVSIGAPAALMTFAVGEARKYN